MTLFVYLYRRERKLTVKMVAYRNQETRVFTTQLTVRPVSVPTMRLMLAAVITGTSSPSKRRIH